MSASVVVTNRLPYVQGHDTPGKEPEPDCAEAASLEQTDKLLGPRETAHARRQIRVGIPAGKEATEQRHDPVEPDPVERCEEAARRRDLEDAEAAARPQDPAELAKSGLEILDVAHAEAHAGGVERPFLERQREHVGLN